MVKSQFGNQQDVVLRGYSEDLGTYHISIYPSLEREISLLDEHFAVQAKSIYPPELSPHLDTSFYHMLCSPL